MTLRVMLCRDDVAAGDNNEEISLDLPDDTRVGHVVQSFIRERYLPEMTWCAWTVAQAGPKLIRRDLALLVTLDHPKDPLVLRLDDGIAGRQPLDDCRWRDDNGIFVFEAGYHTRVGPVGWENYAMWTDERTDM